MESPKPVTQSPESQKRRSLWIMGILALAAVAALAACATGKPGQQAPAVAPASGTHTVTIMPAAEGCSVKPLELKDVGLPDQVCFTNQTTSPIVIDFPTELFGTTSITVPPSATVCIHVGGKAKPGKEYEYSVSCAPDATPRIVIRSN